MATSAVAVQPKQFRPWLGLAVIVHLAISAGLIYLIFWAAINLGKVEGGFPPFPGVLFSMGGMVMEIGAVGIPWLGLTIALALRKRWARWLLVAMSTVWLVPGAFFLVTLDFKRPTAAWDLLAGVASFVPITVLLLPRLGRDMRRSG
jgi:hypothetical protein